MGMLSLAEKVMNKNQKIPDSNDEVGEFKPSTSLLEKMSKFKSDNSDKIITDSEIVDFVPSTEFNTECNDFNPS